jgi:peptide deformylase
LGLAAVQIGVGVRILVVNVGKEGQAPVPLFLVNPEIIRRSRQRVISEESCLSVPGYVGLIQRAHEVTVRYLDYHGMPSERRATGLLAVCIQHEMDHLDGRLFTDHLTFSQRLARRWEEFGAWRTSRRRPESTVVVN